MKKKTLGLLFATALAVLTTAPPTTAEAQRSSGWAPASDAAITPGVQMFTEGAQCTGNLVCRDGAGRGYAAHCAGRGAATDTDGCTTRSLPLGTRVRFARGATVVDPGTTVGRGRWPTARGARCAPAASSATTSVPRTTSPWCGSVRVTSTR